MMQKMQNLDKGFYALDTVPLREGYRMFFRDKYAGDASCGSGATSEWLVVDPAGRVIRSGVTCACGRGCCGHDCVADSWGYHDTCLEDLRADVDPDPSDPDGDPDAVILNGKPASFEACISLMDDEIREALHIEMAPCGEQEFLDAYVQWHLEKHGEEFAI